MLPLSVIARFATLVMFMAGLLGAAHSALAQNAEVALFRVVTVKDEIVVGLPRADLASLGGAAGAIARTLLGRGEMTLKRYAVRKGALGELEFAPSGDVAILGHATLRIEPYSTTLNTLAAR